MCKGGFEFWRNIREVALVSRAATGANEVVVAPANPNRVGFVLGSGGATINCRPQKFTAAANAILFVPATTNPYPALTVATWGQLMFQPWEFVLTAVGNFYNIAELVLPAEYK